MFDTCKHEQASEQTYELPVIETTWPSFDIAVMRYIDN